MAVSLATLHELQAVRAALDDFRAHWASISPIFACPFEGTIADIDALDYLDYEGLRYPAPARSAPPWCGPMSSPASSRSAGPSTTRSVASCSNRRKEV